MAGRAGFAVKHSNKSVLTWWVHDFNLVQMNITRTTHRLTTAIKHSNKGLPTCKPDIFSILGTWNRHCWDYLQSKNLYVVNVGSPGKWTFSAQCRWTWPGAAHIAGKHCLKISCRVKFELSGFCLGPQKFVVHSVGGKCKLKVDIIQQTICSHMRDKHCQLSFHIPVSQNNNLPLTSLPECTSMVLHSV